jgi:hypothetical protein
VLTQHFRSSAVKVLGGKKKESKTLFFLRFKILGEAAKQD